MKWDQVGQVGIVFPLPWLMRFIHICLTFHILYFQWYTWAEILGVSSGGGAYVVKYLLYLICGCFFALLAAMFVRVFAPYACGSGIPEVSSCISVII